MLPFEFENPVKTVFGPGSLSTLAAHIQGAYTRVLVVCAGGPVESNGTLAAVEEQLRAAGAEPLRMGAVASNPKLASVYEGVQAAREGGVDCVLALGGGSAMDCAKLIAASAKTGVDPYEYVWGSRPDVTDSLPTIMVPTIAATGTELNNTAVIVNEKTHEKYWCVCAFPKLCVIDPVLSATLPPHLTVWGAMDVLSHTFEFYLNGDTQSEFQLRFSEAILLSVMHALDILIQDPGNLAARGELLWASAVTWGTGLTKIGRGEPDMACHSIEESFSGYFDTHHGACLGVLTPNWMGLVSQKHPAPFARFARNVMGVAAQEEAEAARVGIEAYRGWLKTVGAPQTYGDLSTSVRFTKEGLDTVADNAWRIYNGHIGRLQQLGKEEVREILYAGLA